MRAWAWAWLVVCACRLDFDDVPDPAPHAPTSPADPSGFVGCGQAMFCDDFESGDLGPWTQNITTGAQLAIETTNVHSGGYALDSNVPAIRNGAAASVILDLEAISTGMLAVREWIYLPQPLIHFDGILNVDNGETNTHYTTVVGDDNGLWDLTERDGVSLFDHHSTVAVPLGRWTCVELDYHFSGPMQLYVDDALAYEHWPVDPTPTYTRASVGITRADAAGAHAIIDDISVGYDHLGCE